LFPFQILPEEAICGFGMPSITLGALKKIGKTRLLFASYQKTPFKLQKIIRKRFQWQGFCRNILIVSDLTL
jgi:hypothetical protein